MAVFSDVWSRYAPASWFDNGLTTRDDVGSNQRTWTREAAPARKGAVSIVAASFVTACMLFSVAEQPVSVTRVEAVAPVSVTEALHLEVPPGYWAHMLSRVRTAPQLEEDAFTDMESLI
jgi:hypothetical protein